METITHIVDRGSSGIEAAATTSYEDALFAASTLIHDGEGTSFDIHTVDDYQKDAADQTWDYVCTVEVAYPDLVVVKDGSPGPRRVLGYTDTREWEKTVVPERGWIVNGRPVL